MLFASSTQLGDDGEGAEFHQRVAEEIEEDRGVGGRSAGVGVALEIGDRGEGDQDVAGVSDGAVGQHALDVGLDERAEVADEHREDGENPECPEPEMSGGGNGGEDAQQQREGGRFGAGGEQRGDRSGSAFVDVGRPELEGGGGDFEAEADQDQGEAEFEEIAGAVGVGHQREIRGAGDAVDQGDAVEEEGGGERAEQEVLHGRFAGLEGVAAISGQDVAGDRAHFEADEGGEKFLRGGEDAHAGGGEQDQGEEFGGFQIFALEIGAGDEDDQNGD